eukprot:scaffold783_cov23-Cyclotella_meneghiniana.AAC.16
MQLPVLAAVGWSKRGRLMGIRRAIYRQIVAPLKRTKSSDSNQESPHCGWARVSYVQMMLESGVKT